MLLIVSCNLKHVVSITPSSLFIFVLKQKNVMSKKKYINVNEISHYDISVYYLTAYNWLNRFINIYFSTVMIIINNCKQEYAQTAPYYLLRS